MSKGQRRSVGRCFIICFIFSIVILLAVSMIMAAVALATKDPTAHLGVFALLCLIVSALIAGVFTSKFNPTEKIGFSLTVALGVTMSMLIVGVIVSRGHLFFGGIMNYICYFGIFALLSYLSGRQRKGHKRKRLR